MTFLLEQIFQLVRLLHSETGTKQIAVGVALGLVLGFSPTLSLQSLLVVLILLVFKVQVGASFLAAFFFKFVAYLLDPLADHLGRWALELESLRSTYVAMYNLPIVPLTRFNNSIVMGSGLIALGLAPLVYFLSQTLIQQYRNTVVARVRATPLYRALQATAFYKWYNKYEALHG